MLRIHSKNVSRLFSYPLAACSIKTSTFQVSRGFHRYLPTTRTTSTSQPPLSLSRSQALSKDNVVPVLLRSFHATKRNETLPIFLAALKVNAHHLIAPFNAHGDGSLPSLSTLCKLLFALHLLWFPWPWFASISGT